MDHYLRRPIHEWTLELEAEYKRYVLVTDWIAATSEVAGTTGFTMALPPGIGSASGYLWATSGNVGRGVLLTIGTTTAGTAVVYTGREIYRICNEWNEIDPMGGEFWYPKRFRDVGNWVGPWGPALLLGPRYFNYGRNAAELWGNAPATPRLGTLRSIGPNAWESSGGLRYVGKDRDRLNRVQHVLRHAVDDATRSKHSVFDAGRKGTLGVIEGH